MRGSITKIDRPKPWLARVDLGIDPVTGKRRQPSKAFARKKEAEAWLAEQLREIDRGTAVDASKTTVREYLAYWLDAYGRPNLRRTTYARYAQLLRTQVYPALGTIVLQRLQPAHRQAFYASRLQEGARLDGKPGGLAPRTVRQLHVILHEALKHAVQWQILGRNVADAVAPPRAHRPPPKA